jgi:NADH-quinone oxidoreductase subunit C
MDFSLIKDDLKRIRCIEGGSEILYTYTDKLRELLLELKNNEKLQYKVLTDVTAVDFVGRRERFEVIYNLLSLKYNSRIIVKVTISENQSLPSIADIYSSAVWYEREVWDMFGIYFDDSKDLRRILTDYGFEGHPLRKDFPLSGHVELRYDEEAKKIVYEPVVLPQEFRQFDFLRPWSGLSVLPGDEKASKS